MCVAQMTLCLYNTPLLSMLQQSHPYRPLPTKAARQNMFQEHDKKMVYIWAEGLRFPVKPDMDIVFRDSGIRSQ
jgi:hypothetical protein